MNISLKFLTFVEMNYEMEEVIIRSSTKEGQYKEILTKGTMLHQGLIYKKLIHREIGLYDEKYAFASDYAFCMKSFYNQSKKFSSLYNPSVNFEMGGVGGSNKSREEYDRIQEEYGLRTKKFNLLKKVVNYVVPYGFILLSRKIRKR